MGSLQLLGLEEGTAAAHREHMVRRGAYLSLLFLCHLRLRELKVKKLNIKSAEIRVNFFKGGSGGWRGGGCHPTENAAVLLLHFFSVSVPGDP